MQENEIRTSLEQHHNDAFGWALSCCGWDRSLAEDVLQAAYLKVLDGRAKFAERSSFKTWLFAVIRRTAGEQRRRLAVRRLLPLEAMGDRPAPNTADASDRLLNSERSAQLVAALKSLPRRQREVLELVFYHDLTIREAADVAGISIGSARTHYHRGKERLRQLLVRDR